ncbi:gag-asp_proteas domain-containing protein [Gossypium australe]|uniref:Gag-asp_proteas domain-containing protein n=1 Tax=Gossypium australe TaxID=47621 RepID=A0A5B6WWX0_9ROSI|nr:gag-asp_proteas domain-containing protein [Gossypium australe]
MLTKFISVSEMCFQNTEVALKNQQVLIKRLKNQISQLAKLISERSQEGLVESKPEPRQGIVVNINKVESKSRLLRNINLEYYILMRRRETTRMNNLVFNYVKILNELLANKRKLDNSSTVELNAVCSARLQNTLSNKRKDLGSFIILCLIGSLNIDNALADLGVSINVMPYKMFKQLGLGKSKQTRISIQLADRTLNILAVLLKMYLLKLIDLYFPLTLLY